jgi:hypothetical protein
LNKHDDETEEDSVGDGGRDGTGGGDGGTTDAATAVTTPTTTASNTLRAMQRENTATLGNRFDRLLVAAMKHNLDEAAELFLWAVTQQSSVTIVNTFAFNLALRGCFNARRQLQLLEVMTEREVAPDAVTINTVATRLILEGDTHTADGLIAAYLPLLDSESAAQVEANMARLVARPHASDGSTAAPRKDHTLAQWKRMELLQEWVGQRGTVRVFRQEFALEDAIGSHACSLEALACV